MDAFNNYNAGGIHRMDTIVKLTGKTPKKVERLRRDEVGALITLSGICTAIKYDIDELKHRGTWVPGLARDFGLLQSICHRVRKAICATVPLDQLMTMDGNMKTSRLTVGVKCANAKYKHDHEYGQFISYADMNVLFDAAKQQCMLCERRRDQENKCPLKQAFDRIGTTIEHNGECGYRYEWDKTHEDYE